MSDLPRVFGQLIPVAIGTLFFGTLFGVIGIVSGNWSFIEAYGGAFGVLFLLWLAGAVFGARS